MTRRTSREKSARATIAVPLIIIYQAWYRPWFYITGQSSVIVEKISLPCLLWVKARICIIRDRPLDGPRLLTGAWYVMREGYRRWKCDCLMFSRAARRFRPRILARRQKRELTVNGAEDKFSSRRPDICYENEARLSPPLRNILVKWHMNRRKEARQEADALKACLYYKTKINNDELGGGGNYNRVSRFSVELKLSWPNVIECLFVYHRRDTWKHKRNYRPVITLSKYKHVCTG